MAEQPYQAIVERITRLLALTWALARQHQRGSFRVDLDQLHSEAARLAADIDAARHDGADWSRHRHPSDVGVSVARHVTRGPATAPSGVPGYWHG